MSDAATDAKSLMDRYEDAFAALHYMIESFQAKDGIPRGQRDRIQRESLARCRRLVIEEIEGTDFETGGMTVDEIVLRVTRKLAEDFLLRIDPILNPEGDDEES